MSGNTAGIINKVWSFCNRDKTSLDITWQSLADLDNLPDPDSMAAEIIENIEAGLENFKEILSSCRG
jgi:type I restriction enzyme M protein